MRSRNLRRRRGGASVFLFIESVLVEYVANMTATGQCVSALELTRAHALVETTVSVVDATFGRPNA